VSLDWSRPSGQNPSERRTEILTNAAVMTTQHVDEDDRVRLTFEISRSLAEELRERALTEDRSVSSLIRTALRALLERR
jgi:Ribbon-helix-helix protein, copG family